MHGFATASFFPGRFFSFFAFFDSLARRPCGLRASFGWSAVKAGIDGIKIAAVQGVLDGFQRLAEALEMDDLPFTWQSAAFYFIVLQQFTSLCLTGDHQNTAIVPLVVAGA